MDYEYYGLSDEMAEALSELVAVFDPNDYASHNEYAMAVVNSAVSYVFEGVRLALLDIRDAHAREIRGLQNRLAERYLNL